MPTTGQWIREKLIGAGDKGVVISDLHRERKANWRTLGITYKGGTYMSFVRLFRWLIDLKWVEQTGEREVAFAKGDTYELKSNRIYYRLTKEGLLRPVDDFYDLITTVHPEWSGSLRSTKYRLPTGKPRGRPRIGPPKIKKLPKPVEVKKPVIKLREIELTEEEKAKVIKEGTDILKEITKREYRVYKEPTKTEYYEWLVDELKIKRRIYKEFIAKQGREPTTKEYEKLRGVRIK